MAKKDAFHDAVKNALIKEGWVITHDPYNRPLARVQRNEFLVQGAFRRAVLRTLKAREFRP